jgi:uncharacterized RDD family membrane protein YckC
VNLKSPLVSPDIALSAPTGATGEKRNGRRAPLWRRGLARATDLATVLFVQWALTVLHVFWFVRPLSEQVAPAATRRRQTFHDMLCATLVVVDERDDDDEGDGA